MQVVGGITKNEVTTGTATRLVNGEVGCVTVNVQAHPTGMVADFGIRVGCCIIKELGDIRGYLRCGGGPIGGNGVECDEHGIIY